MKVTTLFQQVANIQTTFSARSLLLGAFFSGSIALSPLSQADELEAVLSSAYPAQSPVTFIKHESVEQPLAGEEGSEKYMVLDFKIDDAILAEQQLQASIHSICNTVLTDYSLIEQLSNSGYDMISVSFDANNQYDCL